MHQPLVVRLCNWIGDVVLSLPALRLMQAHGFDLHLYGKGWAPTLLSGYDWPVTIRAKTWGDRVRQLGALKRSLAQADPTMTRRINALAMPNSFSSALELRLAGLRVSGYARDGRSLLLAQRQRPGTAPHALESFWSLACGVVGLDLPAPARIEMQVAAAAVERAQAIVVSHGWSGGYICIAPFAAGTVHKQAKKWPDFPAFVQQLAGLPLPIVICPGPGELDEARSLYPGAQIVERLPLDTYAALLKGSRLVVANDTGPAHIAAGVGAPLVSVLGPTKVEQWAPWGPNVTILSQRPAWPQVAQVLDAARVRLEPQP
jgi:heptosyltransferase II